MYRKFISLVENSDLACWMFILFVFALIFRLCKEYLW